MVYTSFLICLALMAPVLGLTALTCGLLLFAAGPRDGWSVLLNGLAFIGQGVAEPLRYGWRIVAIVAAIGLFFTAGAIPALRVVSFYTLALIGTLGTAFCLFFAWREGPQEALTALFVLSPSLAGILVCLWCANKFKLLA